jgi:hypothetical protein
MSALGVERVPKDCGMRCQPYIDSVRLLTRIFGRLTMRFFRASDIKVWGKTVAKLVILSGLIALCASECRV